MSKFQDICDIIAEAEFATDTAEKLMTMMKDYQTRYDRTFKSLMRVPGFHRLWDAIEEAVYHSLGEAR